MKAYCQKCGSGTEYSFDKPKFCASCGTALSVSYASTVPKAPIKKQPQREITHDIEDEEIVTERVPINMRELDVEIEAPINRKVKLENLMGTQGQRFEQENSQGTRLSKKEVMESFKVEAGFYPSRQTMNEQEE
jgi:hypothetical protein